MRVYDTIVLTLIYLGKSAGSKEQRQQLGKTMAEEYDFNFFTFISYSKQSEATEYKFTDFAESLTVRGKYPKKTKNEFDRTNCKTL